MDAMEYLVSVVVPIYNAEKYLKRCIDSILEQTYRNIELIMIDDGSTDSSAEICNEYVNSDSRCRYYLQENSGPDYARKTGVSKANGEYITFLDADDYADELMIEELLSCAVSNDCDMVTSYITRFSDNGRQWITDIVPNDCILLHDTSEMISNYFVTKYLAGAYYGKIYKSELLKDYPFVKNSVIGEDITGVLYALRKSKRVYVTNKSYYYYYSNMNSISHSKYSERHLVSLKNYIRLRDELLNERYIESSPIEGYFAEFEMAVATAMARAGIKDKEAISILRDDVKKHWSGIKANSGTPLYMKLSIALYKTLPNVFIDLYRILYLITGR